MTTDSQLNASATAGQQFKQFIDTPTCQQRSPNIPADCICSLNYGPLTVDAASNQTSIAPYQPLNGQCSEDVGSPLACYRGGELFLVGVVNGQCREAGGGQQVYTKLAPYVDWIYDTINGRNY